MEKHKRTLSLCTLVVLVLIIGMPHPAHAAPGIAERIGSAIMDVAYTFIGKVVYLIGYIVAYIGGIGVALVAWFIGIILNLNNQLLQSDAVQIGFSVSLSVANLGFVLGIIVIAIMTILRQESYGLKQILWKLVAAAILVNFSLVIIAPIFNFANQLTTYFLNCTQGNCNNTGTLAGFQNFAKSLAGAFNPQKELLLGLNTTAGGLVVADTNLQGAFSTTGQSIGKLLVPIVSIFFIAFMLIVMNITLVTFVAMLFIRYLIIGILLIVMPFAWLMWIFPNLSHLWTKWWSTFWRWTLFAPIVIFFLYLAIMTSKTMSTATSGVFYVDTYTSDASGAFGMLANLFGTTFTPLLGSFMQQIIIIGLAVGGIFAANSLSIHGASAAMGAIKGVKNATVGYVGRQSKKGARAAWRGVGGTQATEHLQKGQISRAAVAVPSTLSKKFLNIAGRVVGKKGFGDQIIGAAETKTQQLAESETGKKVGKFAGAAAGIFGLKRLASIGGRQLAEAQHNKDLVDDAKKIVPDDKKELLKNLEGSMRTELRMAYIQKAVDKGWINHDTIVGPAGEKFGKWKDDHEDDFKNYGQGKLIKDSDKAIGSDKEIRKAAQMIENAQKAGVAPITQVTDASGTVVNVDWRQEMNKAIKEFFGGFEKGDINKMSVNEVFGKEAPKAISEALQRGLATYAPQLVSGIINKMDSSTLKEFHASYPQQIREARTAVQNDATLTATEKNELLATIQNSEDKFESIMANNLFGIGAVPAAPAVGGGAAPTPPAGGGH